MLLGEKKAIWACPKSTHDHIKQVIRKSNRANPGKTAQFDAVMRILFGERVAKKRPPKAPVPKGRNPSEFKTLVGTYRCAASGQVAYMRIDRNGRFKLSVELKNGAATGACSARECSVESIFGAAVGFTRSVKSFGIQRRAKTLILNNTTRCEKR